MEYGHLSHFFEKKDGLKNILPFPAWVVIGYLRRLFQDREQGATS